jgi:hypothetical protein
MKRREGSTERSGRSGRGEFGFSPHPFLIFLIFL